MVDADEARDEASRSEDAEPFAAELRRRFLRSVSVRTLRVAVYVLLLTVGVEWGFGEPSQRRWLVDSAAWLRLGVALLISGPDLSGAIRDYRAWREAEPR